MHDNYIIGYDVNIKEKTLNIKIYDKVNKKEKNIYFFDVLTHSFKCILDYNQVLDINDYEMDCFISDNQAELEKMQGYCWPTDYQNMKELKEFLIMNGYKYIKINSSYGMFGWVLAKSYRKNECI